MPAQVGGAGGPVYRVAYGSCGALVVAPVIAWALVEYTDDGDVYEAVEPVSIEPDGPLPRIGNTQFGSDIVLSPGEGATAHWVDVEGKQRLVAEPTGKGAGPWAPIVTLK